MHDEYDYEVAAAREWLGLRDKPMTFGDYVWMFVQLASVSAFVIGACLVAGVLIGDI